MSQNAQQEPVAAAASEIPVASPVVIDPLKVPSLESASTGKAAPLHLNYLDGLRAMAALYVVMYHVFAMMDSDGSSFRGAAKMGSQLFWFGHQAVGLFIVLSGFCLMIPVARNKGQFRGGLVSFFKRRAMRILPPYYFAVGLSWLVILLISATGQKPGGVLFYSAPITPAGVVTHVLLIHDCFLETIQQFNGVLWSISVEWRIYFVFPLLVLLQRRIGIPGATVVALIVGYLLFNPLRAVGLNAHPGRTTGISPHYIGLFALGTLATAICFAEDGTLASLRRRIPWRVLSWGLFCLAVGLCKVKIGGRPIQMAYSDLAVGLWSTALLITLYVDPKTLMHRVLERKLFVFVGTFAYSLYLVHTPLLQMFYQLGVGKLGLGLNASLALNLVLGVPLAVGAAYLFFLGCERPFLQAKNRASAAASSASLAAGAPARQEA